MEQKITNTTYDNEIMMEQKITGDNRGKCYIQCREINVREYQRGNQEQTIQRYWQLWVQKTQDEDKQNKKHNAICV